MAEILVIRLGQSETAPAAWVAVDNSGNRLGSVVHGALEEAAPAAQNRRVYVLLPGVDVLLKTATVPVRSNAKVLQALPYSLEEQLAEDIDGLHFAAGRRDPDGSIGVAIVRKKRFQAWLETLAEAGITADAIYPDSQGVDAVPATLVVLMDEERIYLSGDAQVTVFQDADLEDIVELLDLQAKAAELSTEDETADPTGQHMWVFCSPHHNQHYESYWPLLRAQVSSLDVKLMPDGALPRMAVNLVNQPGINLLQGVYAPKQSYGHLWQPWRFAAALLAGLIVVLIGAKAIELNRLKSVEAQLDQDINTVLSATFPHVSQWRRPREQFDQELQRAVGGPSEDQQSFLLALSTLGRVLRDTPGTRLEALSFRNSVIDIRLIAPNVDALDGIQRGVSEGGELIAEIQAANHKDEVVEGRLQVRRSDQ